MIEMEQLLSILKPGMKVLSEDMPRGGYPLSGLKHLVNLSPAPLFVGSRIRPDDDLAEVTFVAEVSGLLLCMTPYGWDNTTSLVAEMLTATGGPDARGLWADACYVVVPDQPVPGQLTKSVGRDDPFPHSCPLCKSKAYVGFSRVECCGIGCRNYATFKGGVK